MVYVHTYITVLNADLPRFMQELLVKFEPPDLFGVPPSREHPKLILPTSSHGNDLSLPSLDTSLPPVNQPLPSLAGGTESATPTKSALSKIFGYCKHVYVLAG